MYTDSELAETIAALQDPNPSERAAMLKALWAWPSQDDRLLPHIRERMEDSAPCVFGSPMRFGEIRWLAAQVLLAEFKVRQHKEGIRLEGAVTPIQRDELFDRARRAGIECEATMADLLAAFAELRRLGKLPTATLELRL